MKTGQDRDVLPPVWTSQTALERYGLWRKRVSGQGPPGGQPAPAEAFGKAKPAVSDIRRRPIPSKTDTLAREGQVIDQPGLSQPGCTQDTRFGWPFRPAFGQVRQVR